MRLLWIEYTTNEPSRPYGYVWELRFVNPVGKSMIGMVLFPKRGGYPNVHFRGMEFGSDASYWGSY